MGESWRTPNLSRRRSTDADDFSDVFGGPPRSVSGRKASVEFASFYEEIFRQPQAAAPANRSGRSLKAFNIPARSEEFYSDIFGSDREDRSRRSNKGKSSSSASVLSSEELSPHRPVAGDDVALGSFASKLRAINVPSRWNSSTMKPSTKVAFPYNSPSSQRVTSPEMIDYESESYRSFRIPMDYSVLDSPSAASSLCQNWEDKTGFYDLHDDDDDEVMSSYVIEIKSDHYNEGNDDAIGEAIAWAKQKFHQHSPKKDWSAGHSSMQFSEKAKMEEKLTTEAKQQSEDDRESRLVDEDMEMWSSGKETT